MLTKFARKTARKRAKGGGRDQSPELGREREKKGHFWQHGWEGEEGGS